MEGREKTIAELEVKLNRLLERHQAMGVRLQVLEQQNRLLKEQNDALSENMGNLKKAKALVLGNNDAKETRLLLSRLIREIDKCIALMSV